LRLFEPPDFEQAILRATEHFRGRKLRPAIIEKDYYVTEALRVIAATSGDKIIFKGGTSLAKGWNLIERFSEDIDIFLDPGAFQPTLGKNAIDRELKKLRHAVGRHPALAFVQNESQTIGGFGRNDRSLIRKNSQGQARLPIAPYLKPARRVDASHPSSLRCVHIWASTYRKAKLSLKGGRRIVLSSPASFPENVR
jgi:hypothetical protein